MQTCLDHPELQNEIYCQLIKQTSKHVHRGPEDLGVGIPLFLPDSSHLVSCIVDIATLLPGSLLSLPEGKEERPVETSLCEEMYWRSLISHEHKLYNCNSVPCHLVTDANLNLFIPTRNECFFFLLLALSRKLRQIVVASGRLF